MHYYLRHARDHRAETAHLTLLEEGAYCRLLDTYMLTEKTLPLDESVLMRTHCARNAEEVQAVLTVLKEFFVQTENGWLHPGCEQIITEYRAKSDRAKSSANARWEKKKPSPDANALRTQCKGNANQEPITNKNIKDDVPPFSEKAASGEKDKLESLAFERFWNNYPRKDGKKKAESVFKRLSKASQELAIADCAHRFKYTEKRFIPHASTYLNAERWLDPLPTSSQTQSGASQQPVHWHQTSSGITAKGKELGLREDQFENFVYFRDAVFKAAKEANPGLRIAR